MDKKRVILALEQLINAVQTKDRDLALLSVIEAQQIINELEKEDESATR